MIDSLPPGSRTNLAVHRLSGALIEDHGDHLVVRSPRNPLYHWGNYVHVTTGDVNDADRWLSVFSKSFPQAAYRAVALPSALDPSAWSDRGIDLEFEDCLIADVECGPAITPTAVPNGYAIRALACERDWAAWVEAEIAESQATKGPSEMDVRRFVEDSFAVRRELAEQGHLAWFAAFTDAGEPAAALGIVLCGVDESAQAVEARYQHVLTVETHRRHGLARHLLAVAAAWAEDRGVQRLVIMADTGTPAARLYAAAGFGPGPRECSAYAPGPR